MGAWQRLHTNRLLCAGVLIVGGAASLVGQSRIQASVGRGSVSAPRIAVFFADLFSEGLTFGGYHAQDAQTTGARTLALGWARGRTTYELSGTFETITSSVLLDDGDKVRDGTQRFTSDAMLLGVTRNYGGDGSARFFSGFALGPAFASGMVSVKDSTPVESHKTVVAFQADLLGLSVGRSLSAYGVVGFGYRGIARVGAAYLF